MVRIRREKQFIQVFFEANVVMFNGTNKEVVVGINKEGGEEKVTIHENRVQTIPLTWFLSRAPLLFHHPNSSPPSSLFPSLSTVCDPRIVNPYHDHSTVISTADATIAVDIFYLKTKTAVGQFLIVFQPVLIIQNLLFMELNIGPADQPD